jgi:hypothetical protein
MPDVDGSVDLLMAVQVALRDLRRFRSRDDYRARRLSLPEGSLTLGQLLKPPAPGNLPSVSASCKVISHQAVARLTRFNGLIVGADPDLFYDLRECWERLLEQPVCAWEILPTGNGSLFTYYALDPVIIANVDAAAKTLVRRAMAHQLTARQPKSTPIERLASYARIYKDIALAVPAQQADEMPRPRWDGDARRLYIDDVLVKEYDDRAKSQMPILDQFQKLGWPKLLPLSRVVPRNRKGLKLAGKAKIRAIKKGRNDLNSCPIAPDARLRLIFSIVEIEGDEFLSWRVVTA